MNKVVMVQESKVRSNRSPDQQLADHLEKAEEHLIAAAVLFEKSDAPKRATRYVSRLHMAQEAVTGLRMEELVRIRDEKKKRKK